MLIETWKRIAAAVLGAGLLLGAGAANAQPGFALESFTGTGAKDPDGAGPLPTYYPVAFLSGFEDHLLIGGLPAILDGLAYYARVEMQGMRLDGTTGMPLRLSPPNTPPATGCPGAPITAYNERGGTITHMQNIEHGTVSVYSLSKAVSLAAGGCMRLGPGDAGVKPMITPARRVHKTLVVKLYDTLSGAINAREANLLHTTRLLRVAYVNSVVTAWVTPMDPATASVERGFAAFAGASPNVANLAYVKLLTQHLTSHFIFNGTLNADGTVTPSSNNQNDVVANYRSATAGAGGNTAGGKMTEAGAAALLGTAKSTVYIKSDRGDFSEGDYYLSGGAGCPNAKLAKIATGERKGQLMGLLGRTGKESLYLRNTFPQSDGTTNYNLVRSARSLTAPGGCVLSVNVKANADNEAAGKDFQAIKAQKFSADIVGNLAYAVPAALAADSEAHFGGAAGEIKRDGTTVQLPYLTTRPGYMHKVTLTNRGTKAADFWIENVSSSDGTGAASKVTSATPMNVAAQSRKSIAAGDLVDFGTSGTEGAATLSVNAARANVSIATVLTNMASNSTDTLSLVEPVAAADVATAPITPTTTPGAGTGGNTGGGTAPTVAQNCSQAATGALGRPCVRRVGATACDDTQCCNRSGGGRCTFGGANDCPIPAC